MPSPGIGFGDLAVFISVLVVVAVFLAAVRSVLKRAEAPEVPVEGERDRPAEKPRATGTGQVTSPQSALR